MDINELANAVFQEQGFLVIGATHPHSIGDIIANPFFNPMQNGERIFVGLQIVAPSNAEEMWRQSARAKLQHITFPSFRQPLPFTHYYRTIPLD